MGRSSPLMACHYLTYYYLLSIILSQRSSYFLSRSVSALSILTLKTPPTIISQITNCILNSRFVFLASYLASYADDDCVDDDLMTMVMVILFYMQLMRFNFRFLAQIKYLFHLHSTDMVHLRFFGWKWKTLKT